MAPRKKGNHQHPPTPTPEVVEELARPALAIAKDADDVLAPVKAMAPIPVEPEEMVRKLTLADEVYALRMAGYTPREIAHNLSAQLKRRVTSEEVDELADLVAVENIHRTNAQIASTFQLELDRLDAAMKAIWPQVQGGNLLAIDRMDKLQQRRAKMLGLDAPDIRAQITLTSEGLDLSGLSADELEAYKKLHLKALSAAQNARAPKVGS